MRKSRARERINLLFTLLADPLQMAKARFSRPDSTTNLQVDHRLTKVPGGDARAQQEMLAARVEEIAPRRPVSIDCSAALNSVSNIRDNEAITAAQKIEELKAIQAAAARHSLALISTELTEAPLLWSDRGAWKASPCDFVKAHYPNYATGLCISDIAKLDVQLHRALYNYRARYGWPDDFVLPDQYTRDAQISMLRALIA